MSKIEWTDETWNPTRGCSRVSAGCEHCYAERQAHRLSGPGQPYEGLTAAGKHGPRWTGEVRLVPEMLDRPLRWRKPRRVFVDSMSDLFHEQVPFGYIAAVFGVMAASPQHTFQLLTKRAGRMREFFGWLEESVSDTSYLGPAEYCEQLAYDETGHITYVGRNLTDAWPLPNVHMYVSVENQATADERFPELLACPAAVRGVSYEPALGPVDFGEWIAPMTCCNNCGDAHGGDLYLCPSCETDNGITTWGNDQSGPPLDHIIVGGESGPGARPFDVAWARDTIAACKAAGVPVFVKQLGAWAVEDRYSDYLGQYEDPAPSLALRHPKGADMSEWPEDLRVREMPNA